MASVGFERRPGAVATAIPRAMGSPAMLPRLGFANKLVEGLRASAIADDMIFER